MNLQQKIALHSVVPDQDPPDPALFGRWERFEAASAHGPVRPIALTPEIIAADAEERAKREALQASAWRARLQLSEKNLQRKPRHCRTLRDPIK